MTQDKNQQTVFAVIMKFSSVNFYSNIQTYVRYYFFFKLMVNSTVIHQICSVYFLKLCRIIVTRIVTIFYTLMIDFRWFF